MDQQDVPNGEGARRFFEQLAKRLGASATVKVVYGDPVEAQGKTVIPVARVAYGFGAGWGAGRVPAPGGEAGGQVGSGTGGGGGVKVDPIGFVEVTGDTTRFVPIQENRFVLAALGVGLAVGLILGRRWGHAAPARV